jgi:hypothetical protein
MILLTSPSTMNLAPEQQKKIRLMLAHVTRNMQIHHPRFANATLMNKFLVAKDYNLDKAIKLFEAYIKFRVEKDIDRLIMDDFSRLQQFLTIYPRQLYFNDKEGRPVVIEQIGKANFKELFKVGLGDA